VDRDVQEIQNRVNTFVASPQAPRSPYPIIVASLLFIAMVGWLVMEANRTQPPAGDAESLTTQRNGGTLSLSQDDKDAIIQGVYNALKPTPTNTPTATSTPRATVPPTPDRLLTLPRCGDIVLTPVTQPTAVECRPEQAPVQAQPTVVTPTTVPECQEWHFDPSPTSSCSVLPPVVGAAVPTLAPVPSPPCFDCVAPTPRTVPNARERR